MSAEIQGQATERIAGHLAGSRAYGSHTRTSDWDYSFEDRPSTVAFLTAAGFKRITDFPAGTRGNSRSYWKHRYYNCEVFLTTDNEIKQTASWIVKWLQRFEILHDKHYRIRVWSAIETCLSELWAAQREYKAEKNKKDADGFSLRDHPVK